MNALLLLVWIAGAVPVLLSVVWGMPYIVKYEVFDSRAKALRRGGYLAFILALPVGWLSVTTAFPEQFGRVESWQTEVLVWINLAFILHAYAWWLVWWLIRRSNRRSHKAALNDKRIFDKAKRQRVKKVQSFD